jgi:thymidine phosphorylase
MRAADIIRNKREGRALQPAEIDYFVKGITDGSLPDYQASALLMAIFLRGMTAEETALLTDAMVRSGARMTYPDLPGVAVDKHSTGGVGDKTSLILAPLAVACGAAIPMMSGRGLGHTGGTLDKLESIPGFVTSLSLFSVFFMPLTFIVGIYGMNFDNMPELKWDLGYYGVLGLCVIVSVVIYLWFKRKRWL